MSIELSLPKTPEIPERIPLRATASPDWNPDRVTELARALHLRADVQDAGIWFLARDAHASLEVYQASASLRYSLTERDAESTRSVEHDDGTVIEAAESWLRDFGPERRGGQAKPAAFTVTSQLLLISESPKSEPREIVTGRQVNVAYELDGLPLIGPGAKAQVTIDAEGGVSSAYSFWRDSEPTRDLATVSIDETYARFRRSRMFSGIDEAHAEVTSVRIGHFAAPPTETQALLAPAYELRGIVRMEGALDYEFVRYLPATHPLRARREAAELRTTLLV